jgi:hypothetical protein
MASETLPLWAVYSALQMLVVGAALRKTADVDASRVRREKAADMPITLSRKSNTKTGMVGLAHRVKELAGYFDPDFAAKVVSQLVAALRTELVLCGPNSGRKSQGSGKQERADQPFLRRRR